MADDVGDGENARFDVLLLSSIRRESESLTQGIVRIEPHHAVGFPNNLPDVQSLSGCPARVPSSVSEAG